MKDKEEILNINPDKISSVSQAKELLKKLLNFVEQLISGNNQLSKEIQRLQKKIAKLQKQSGRPEFKGNGHQGNDDYSAKAYLKDKDKKKPHHKSSKQIPIDREETLPEVEKCSCGSKRFVTIRTWQKIIQGLIIKRDNILYQGKDKQCCLCGKVCSSLLPPNTSGYQFSPQLRTWLSLFKYQTRMSELLIHRFLSGLGIKISLGEINKIILENSYSLIPSYTHLKVWGVKLSQVLQSDATGLIKQMILTGRRIHQHLHFLGHRYLSLFKITFRYNSLVLSLKVLGKRAKQKIFVSDDASPNGKKLTIEHKQLCFIHEIRHYLKLLPKIKIHRKETETVVSQFWDFYREALDYNLNPNKEKRLELNNLFDAITNQKVSYDQLTNRLKLTHRKKNRLLLFFDYPGIPIENNLAERDLRPAVIIRKLSGGTKSEAGNRSFERHLSIIQTIQKQGLNTFDTLYGLINGTLSPFVLTQKTQPALAVSR